MEPGPGQSGEHRRGGASRPLESGVRRTARWVRVQDRVAEIAISAGGLIVLLAMLGICVFLVASAAPLFASGTVEGERARYSVASIDPGTGKAGAPRWMSSALG